MNFDEIIVKESPGLCRCCLSEGCYKDLGSEYTWMNDREVYADMLLDCFDIGITQHNDGPNGAKRLICEVCITRLRDACNFKKQVLDSEKRFIDMLGRGEFRPKVLLYQPQNQEMKAETVEPAEADLTDVEYLEDIDFGDEDEEIKTEEIQSTSMPTTSEEPEPPKLKRGRPKKEEEKPEKPTKVVKKAKVSKDLIADEKIDEDKWRENLRIIFDYTSIIPFNWIKQYACFYCNDLFQTHEMLRKHTRTHGLITKETLISLITSKEINFDVSEIRCNLCGKEFKSVAVIIDHLIEDHGKVYDKSALIPIQEYSLCDLKCLFCEEEFINFEVLANHVETTHSKYECNDCGGVFTKLCEIELHIKSRHVLALSRFTRHTCDNSHIKRHIQKVHKNFGVKQCCHCYAMFKNDSSLKKHMAIHHPSERTAMIKCQYCLKDIPSTENMKEHASNCKVKTFKLSKKANYCHRIRQNVQCVLNKSTAVPFKYRGSFLCFYCSALFHDFEPLKAHTREHHQFCDLNSKTMKACKGEKACIKVDINDLACKECRLPMSDLSTFIDHAIAEHDADYEPSIPIKECFEVFRLIPDKVPCPECQKPFPYFSTMLKHLGAVHFSNHAICAYCGRGWRSKSLLNMHIINTHSGSSECTVCKAKCKNAGALNRHMARFHDAKMFVCSKCPEHFETVYKKQVHMIEVHNIGHKCDQCGRMFTRNSFLIDHIKRSHLKERNVICSICDARFFDNYLLKLHMVKHIGIRKYQCNICGKAFLRPRNLQTHMGIHKREADNIS